MHYSEASTNFSSNKSKGNDVYRELFPSPPKLSANRLSPKQTANDFFEVSENSELRDFLPHIREQPEDSAGHLQIHSDDD